MKNIILVLLLLLLSPISTNAQKKLAIDPETHAYKASDVISIDSISAEQLYKRTLEWVAINYKSSKDVIQYQDLDGKKIILKGNFGIYMFMKEGWITHTLTLEFKEDKYRYSYDNLSYYSSGSGEMPFERNMLSKKKMIEKADEKINESVKSLNSFLKSDPKISNW